MSDQFKPDRHEGEVLFVLDEEGNLPQDLFKDIEEALNNLKNSKFSIVWIHAPTKTNETKDTPETTESNDG